MFEYTHKLFLLIFISLTLASCGGGSSSTNFSSNNSNSTNTSVPSGNASVFLTWTPPTQNTDNTPLVDLTGYKIYYGVTSDNLSSSILITDATASSATVSSLSRNTQYYFAIKVLNSKNIESDFSNIIRKTGA